MTHLQSLIEMSSTPLNWISEGEFDGIDQQYIAVNKTSLDPVDSTGFGHIPQSAI